MPQWAGSCWYYIRYLQPWNDSAPVDPEVEQYWLPVDLYMGMQSSYMLSPQKSHHQICLSLVHN